MYLLRPTGTEVFRLLVQDPVQIFAPAYHRLSKICPWAMNLSGCSKWGVGIFLRTLSLSKIGPPHLKVGPSYLKVGPPHLKVGPPKYSKNPDITDL